MRGPAIQPARHSLFAALHELNEVGEKHIPVPFTKATHVIGDLKGKGGNQLPEGPRQTKSTGRMSRNDPCFGRNARLVSNGPWAGRIFLAFVQRYPSSDAHGSV